MKCIITIDMKDYDERWIHFKRPSVRGVIIKNHKVAMVLARNSIIISFRAEESRAVNGRKTP